jgi:hypothetical protein
VPPVRIAALLFLPLLLAGCFRDTRESRERGGMMFGSEAQEIRAPLRDRCDSHGKSAMRGPCEEAKYLAQLYARKLSVGDEVCLEGGFGDNPGGACLARAAVVDTATNRALLEVRDARPESRWFKRVQNEVWFEEGALVDLYLAEHGY